MMTKDRRLDDAISGWLEADAPPRIPDRVLGATFERTRATRQERGLSALLGRIQMQRPTLAIGAVAAVLVLVVGVQFLGRPAGSGGQPSPTPAASAAPSPVASPSPRATSTGLAGPFLLIDGDLKMTITVGGSGWQGDERGGAIVKRAADPPAGAGMIVFVDPSYVVYGDACTWKSTTPASTIDTVDAMIAALAAQTPRDASAPADVTVGGYAGKSITLRVPKDAVYVDGKFTACDDGLFGSWAPPGATDGPGRYNQGPGQIDKVFVIKVKDRLVLIDYAYYDGTPAEDVAALEAMVASAVFE